MSKIENGGLDQYGPEPFEQQQFGTAGVEGVNALAIQVEKKTGNLPQKNKTLNAQLTCEIKVYDSPADQGGMTGFTTHKSASQ